MPRRAIQSGLFIVDTRVRSGHEKRIGAPRVRLAERHEHAPRIIERGVAAFPGKGRTDSPNAQVRDPSASSVLLDSGRTIRFARLSWLSSSHKIPLPSGYCVHSLLRIHSRPSDVGALFPVSHDDLYRSILHRMYL